MKKLLAIIVVLAGLAGCTKRIDVNLNDQGFERLVVDGWITNQKGPHTVRLTKTTDYFENEAAPRAEGAQVTISDGTETIVLSENEPGIYQTTPEWRGKTGHTYTLNIDYNGETYEATEYLDTVPRIDSILYDTARIESDQEVFEEYRELYLFTRESPGEGDHYMWRFFKNGTLLTDTLNEYLFVDDLLVDGNYIYAYDFDGFNWVEAEPGDTLTIEQHKISGGVYDNFEAVMLETEWRGGIFDSPPANVPSNISNGAVGFFIASGIDRYTLPIEY